MNNLTLKHHIEKLYSFKVAAELESITAAASKLNVTQSSLSHAIKNLEELLQIKLFIRKPRGVSLSIEGKTLYDFSEKIFHETDKIELELRNFAKNDFGILKIGTHETLATHIWPPILKKINHENKNLSISILSSRVDSIIKDVLSGKLDVALTVEPINNPKLNKVALYSGEFGIYTAQKDKRQKVRLSSLDNETILTDNHAHFKQGVPIPQQLALAGFKLNKLYHLNSFEAAINFCAAGMGVCVIPKRNAQAALKSRKIKELKVSGFAIKEFSKYTICASYLKSNENKFIKMLIDKFSEEFNK